jgi:dTDP-4-dehydrorhamnose 3,5-epimerase
MRYQQLEISGAWLIDIEPNVDDRGFFARTFCSQEFSAHGLPQHFVQSSISYNEKRATLRGLHLQKAPSREVKLVRCVAGSIYDVVVDLRPDSDTFCKWVGVELSAQNRSTLVVPFGCAHGFITLEDCAELLYMMSEQQNSLLATGFRWNDPAFSIAWPIQPQVISERDAAYPDFSIKVSG